MPGQNTSWIAGLGLTGERAIDVGCGPGHATERLAADFDYVLGVDLSEPMIELARAKRSRPNLEYRVADLFAVDDDGFDLVYSHTMMHHLPDYRAGLVQLKSLVRPGGTVALIDNVCDRYPTPPRRVYTWGALLGFPRQLRRIGWRDAWFELRFWHSKPWLEHLLSDVLPVPSPVPRAVRLGLSGCPVRRSRLRAGDALDRRTYSLIKRPCAGSGSG